MIENSVDQKIIIYNIIVLSLGLMIHKYLDMQQDLYIFVMLVHVGFWFLYFFIGGIKKTIEIGKKIK